MDSDNNSLADNRSANHLTDQEPPATPARSSRARHACKPELKSLIDLVNLIPPDKEMKNIHDLLGEGDILHRPGTPEWTKRELRLETAFVEYAKSFPEYFLALVTSKEEFTVLQEVKENLRLINQESANQRAVASKGERESKLITIFQNQQHRYYRIRAVRDNLYKLAAIGQHPDEYLGKLLKDVVLEIPLIENARLDENGFLRRPAAPFAEAIEGVEVSRLRSCEICRKLFWAGRSDKVCCSEAHSRIIRKKKIREQQKVNKDLYARSAKRRRISGTKGSNKSDHIREG